MAGRLANQHALRGKVWGQGTRFACITKSLRNLLENAEYLNICHLSACNA